MSLSFTNQDPNNNWSQTDSNNNRSPLRNPSLDATEHIWIALVVIIPIIFTFILCLIAAYVYRYKKKRAQRNTINSSMIPIDEHNASIATIFQNSIVMEDAPPSYDIISEIKKEPQFIINNNANEVFQLSSIKTETTFPSPSVSYNSDATNPPK